MENSYLDKLKESKKPIRRKIYAAVSLLLIAVVLLNVASYAWLTISDKPEMIGVSSTIGANGSLEIALAEKEHLSKIAANDMFDVDGEFKLATGEPYVDNVLWGNVIDLSDSRYGLSDTILRPSVLNVLGGAVQRNNPLIVAAYGHDGRVAYEENYTSISGYDPESQTFQISKGKDYGVRIAGTPLNAELMDRIKTLGSNTRLRAAYTTSEIYDVLREFFYYDETPGKTYSSSAIRNALDKLLIIDSEYERSVKAIEEAFSGKSADPEEAALTEAIYNNRALAESLLESAVAAIDEYELAEARKEAEANAPEGTEIKDEDLEPKATTLSYTQARDILAPLVGAIEFYSWEFQYTETKNTENADGEVEVYYIDHYDWELLDTKPDSEAKIRIKFGADSYFAQVAALCDGFSANGNIVLAGGGTGTLQWITPAVDYSQIFYLSGQTMASKFLEYLGEFEVYSAQTRTRYNTLRDIIEEEYEAETDFFYELTIAPPAKATTDINAVPDQPFTADELENYKETIGARVDSFESIVDFLEAYTKAAVLVYASSGVVDRAVYLDVIAVAVDEKATLRDYIEAAGLDGDFNYKTILEYYEQAREDIKGWRIADEDLQNALEPKDEEGNVIKTLVRDMNVNDLLSVWDAVEDMSGFTLRQYDRANADDIYYTADNFGSNSVNAFVDTLAGFSIPHGEGIIGLAAYAFTPNIFYNYDNELATYQRFILGSDKERTENAAYLNGNAIDANVYGYYTSWWGDGNDTQYYTGDGYLEGALNRFETNFAEVTDNAKWTAAYGNALNVLNAGKSSGKYKATMQGIAEIIADRIISAKNSDYSSSYYGYLQTMIDDAKSIEGEFENALAAQVLLYAAGLAAQEDADNAEKEEEAAEKGEEYTPKTTATELLAELTAGRMTDGWNVDELLSKISVSANYYFDSALEIYYDLSYRIDAAEDYFKRLSSGKLGWAQIDTVLSCFIENQPENIVYYEPLISSGNGGIFTDFSYVLNWSNDLQYWNELTPAVNRQVEHNYGLPADVDEKYDVIGFTNVDDDLLTRSDAAGEYNAIAQIEYTVDRSAASQKYSSSDREYIFATEKLRMDSAAALANRNYEEYLANSGGLYGLLYDYAMNTTKFMPETDEEENADGSEDEEPEMVYTQEEVQAAIDSLTSLQNALTSAETAVRYALRVLAASDETDMSKYEAAIVLHDITALFSALGLKEGNVLYDLNTKIMSYRSTISGTIVALEILRDTPSYWVNDAAVDNYIRSSICPRIAPEGDWMLNGRPLSEWNEYIADCENGNDTSIGWDSEKEGKEHIFNHIVNSFLSGVWVRFEVVSGTLADIHTMFAKDSDGVHVYYGDKTIDLISYDGLFATDIPVRFAVIYTPEAHFDNAITWTNRLAPPQGSTASGLNENSNYIIADTYAIAIDFLLRTNVSGANLLLQTEAVQRIYNGVNAIENEDNYSDEVIAEMMGGGSFIEFADSDPSDNKYWEILASDDASDEARQEAWIKVGGGILRAINVVFADTLTGDIYAYARPVRTTYSVDDHTISGELVIVDEYGYEVESAVIKELTQNKVSAITAWVYLDADRVDNSMMETERISTMKLNIQFTTDIQLYAAKPSINSASENESE